MEREKFLHLLSKKRSGKISAAEADLLEQALLTTEAYKQTDLVLEQYLSPSKKEIPTVQLKNIWKRIENNDFHDEYDYTLPATKGYFGKTLFKIAALFAVILSVGVLGYYFNKRNSHQSQATLAAVEQKTFKILDDGTRIWLNRHSTIRYNHDFGKNNREVFLNGEAYFDVVKNPAVPLVIHAGEIDITVKGTAFNLNAYPQNKEISISLDRGLIEVANRLDKTYHMLLRPNEKLTFLKNLPKNALTKFSITPLNDHLLLTASNWTSDTLNFSNEKLKELRFRLEKKYQVKIDIQSVQLGEKRFSGGFINETLLQAMEALKLAYPFNYTIRGKLVILKD